VESWIWFDGVVSPASTARVSATDRGLLLGDGVFETCVLVGGTPFALTRHLARLRRSAQIVGLVLPWPDSLIRSACDDVILAARGAGGSGSNRCGGDRPETNPSGTGVAYRLRMTVTGGSGPLGPDRRDVTPTLLVAVGPTPARPATATVVTVPWRLNEHSPTVGAKTTSYLDHLLALDEARRQGADEAVLANTAGALCEGTGSNIFVADGATLCTPSTSTGCLAGVTRALVCEGVEVVERDDLTLDQLRSAPEAFLTSSIRRVHPISRIDGQDLPGSPGPLTLAAAAALTAVQARTTDP